MDATNNAVYVTGTDSGSVAFDSHVLNNSQWSAYIAKLTVPYSPLSVKSAGYEAGILMFPNPTDNAFTISTSDSDMPFKIQVRNALGQIVLNDSYAQFNSHISLGKFGKGIYFVEVT